uniref:Uncharacterized protein n=1 Tax=Panagrolaimus sp. PS1159 TaxID=55785 RepID=A0AC35GHV5_9BILA
MLYRGAPYRGRGEKRVGGRCGRRCGRGGRRGGGYGAPGGHSGDSRERTAVGSEMYLFQRSNHQEMFSHGICFLNGFKKNARVVQEHGKSAVKLVDPVVSAFYGDHRLADSFHFLLLLFLLILYFC